MISMESRHGSDIQAQATADRDAAFGQSESASQLALNQDDLDEINAVDVTAPVAAVARVLELSEEVQDRIAADNDALTDSFAAQAMEQSDPDETNTVPRNQNQARIGAVAVAGCIVSAVLIAVVRRFRRGRNKSSEKSSQRISGSTRGSRYACWAWDAWFLSSAMSCWSDAVYQHDTTARVTDSSTYTSAQHIYYI